MSILEKESAFAPGGKSKAVDFEFAVPISKLPSGGTQLGGAQHHSLLFAGAIAAVFVVVGLGFLAYFALSLLVVTIAGAAGGILYAIRGSELVSPKIQPDRSIHLGWVADCAYGVAGAFVVFLVVPGMSEGIDHFPGSAAATDNTVPTPGKKAETDNSNDQSPASSPSSGGTQNGAVATPQEAAQATIASPPSVDRAKPRSKNNEIDLIEFIAVALVGGYAGHALIKRAADPLGKLEEKVETARYEIERRAEEIKTRLNEYIPTAVDAEAVILAVRQLSGDPPSSDELRAKIVAASYVAKARIFREAELAFRSQPDKIAPRLVPLLKALVDDDLQERFHRTRALLAQAYGSLGDWQNAQHWIAQAIQIRDKTGDGAFPDYEEFLATCKRALC